MVGLRYTLRLTVSKFFFNDPRSWMDRDVIGTCSPSIFVDEKEEVGQVLQGKGVVSGRVEGFKLKFSLESPKRSLEELSINFGVALFFFACNDFCPQSVNRAKNQNSAQNLKTVTVSFGIFEAVFWEVENISASKTSTNKPSHI